MIRSFAHAGYPPELLLERKGATVSVVLHARDGAETIGPAVDRIRRLGRIVDQLLVIHATPEGFTAPGGRRAGAEVQPEAELAPGFGPVLGRGDAMWRALGAVRGELVVFAEAHAGDLAARVSGLLGPLICEEGIRFVKPGPAGAAGGEPSDDAGRVGRLTARPLLSAFYPALAALRQPLARELAASRTVLELIPFAAGEEVEMAMLLDVLALVGCEAMAQAGIGPAPVAEGPSAVGGPSADAVLAVLCERLRREGRLSAATRAPPIVERPPWSSLRATV